MIEASQSLANASATLSIAAQAMSKAAACLAAMGGGCDDCTFGLKSSSKVHDWAGSPDWTQNSYNLPQIPAPKDVGAVDHDHRRTGAEEVVPIKEAFGSVIQEQREAKPIQVNSDDTRPLEPAPSASKPPAPTIASTEVPSTSLSDQSTPNAPGGTRCSEVKPALPVVAPKSQVDLSLHSDDSKPGGQTSRGTSTVSVPVPKPAPATTASSAPTTKPIIPPIKKLTAPPTKKATVPSPTKPKIPITKPAAPTIKPKAPITKPTTATPNTHPGQPAGTSSNRTPCQATGTDNGRLSSHTRIILDYGFDSLPALCRITKRFAKTVCLYNYSGLNATTSSAVMVKANVDTTVIVPQSTKKDKLDAAVKKFNSAQSGILLWPGCNALPTVTGLTDSPNIQLIQLGQPTKANSEHTCLNTTLILAKSEAGQPHVSKVKQYPLDALNNECNKQGPKSPLQPFRIWLRARLSKDSFARRFYWDWFLDHRKHNPSQKVIDTLKLANQYAEQFLLRGESKAYGEPVGGKVTVTEGAVKSLKLQEAVRMGILLVARS
ncbi:unnamed protein product [Rhizoctonia solani]|uniref:Uncharacterized protein n=1 Tax=Rhizoctonia solani TaxID=456999 RepID=A0A8H2ZX14_9AGAM|nr:unnamed protein product [Rhizoctonia solani]